MVKMVKKCRRLTRTTHFKVVDIHIALFWRCTSNTTNRTKATRHRALYLPYALYCWAGKYSYKQRISNQPLTPCLFLTHPTVHHYFPTSLSLLIRRQILQRWRDLILSCPTMHRVCFEQPTCRPLCPSPQSLKQVSPHCCTLLSWTDPRTVPLHA